MTLKMSRATEETEGEGWVLLIVGNERHYFFGKDSVCGLFVPAISSTDYEERNDGNVQNCFLCEEGLEILKNQANYSFCGTGQKRAS